MTTVQTLYKKKGDEMTRGNMQRPASVAALVGAGCLTFLISGHATAGCFQFAEIGPAVAYSRSETSLLSATPVAHDTLLPADSDDAVVGLWTFKLSAEGTEGLEDGTPIDFGYQVLHSDGTELLNSEERASMTQSYCTGAWQQVSNRHYVLNHTTVSLDPIGALYVGPHAFTEEIVVDDSRKHFTGHFTLVEYSADQTTILREVRGVVTGDRITTQ